jgi:hypothetical protein
MGSKAKVDKPRNYSSRQPRMTPAMLKLILNLGLILAEQGRLADAEKEIQNALGIGPDSPRGLTALAMVQAKLGRLGESAASPAGVQFVLSNCATAHKYQIEPMVAGVAMFDYNNDGLIDIYFVNGAIIPELVKTGPEYYNRLYKNNGNGTFADVTERAGVKAEGYSMGVAAGDHDNDGWEDLYVVGVNRNFLFHNNGDGTFAVLYVIVLRRKRFGDP